LFYKQEHQSSISTGWESLPRLESFSQSWSAEDYGNMLGHMIITEGIVSLSDGYEDIFSAEVDNEFLDEGEIYKMLFLKYVIMNLKFLISDQINLDIKNRLLVVFNDSISCSDQVDSLNVYVLHIENLLTPYHNLRGRMISY